MNEDNLIKYYNKFNEDKRLDRRHGIVEFTTAIKYIEEILSNIENPKIIDVGCGTGKYSIYLKNKGYDVTAVELVKHNLMTLKKKDISIKSYLGNAKDLSRFDDKSYDMVLLFGPMYHLISMEDKLMALKEAKRIVKENGFILISYYMNEYAIITHGFKDNTIKEAIKNNLIDSSFHVTPKKDDLYSMVRLDDINYLKDNNERLYVFPSVGKIYSNIYNLDIMNKYKYPLFLRLYEVIDNGENDKNIFVIFLC